MKTFINLHPIIVRDIIEKTKYNTIFWKKHSKRLLFVVDKLRLTSAPKAKNMGYGYQLLTISDIVISFKKADKIYSLINYGVNKNKIVRDFSLFFLDPLVKEIINESKGLLQYGKNIPRSKGSRRRSRR